MDYDLNIIMVAQYVHNVRDGGHVPSTASYAGSVFNSYDNLILQAWEKTQRPELTVTERTAIAAMAACDTAPFPDAAVGRAVTAFINSKGL